MSDSGFPLPPATFEFLAISLKTQAEIQLGLLDFGGDQEGGQPQVDLRMARHTIDMLAMLQEKTRGNLTIEEQRLLDNSLTELRFRYVQAVEKQQQAKQQPAEADSSQARAAES